MKTIPVKASGSYEVHIGSGALAQLPQELSRLVRGKTAAVIADLTVWELYGADLVSALRQAGYQVPYLTVHPGEGSKSLGGFAEAMVFLAEAGLRRDDCVIALGGGVTGDLAGFAAACYMRGIAYIQVPTSLLAMVDSSVGGKTAININPELPKNICGAFHQPAAVFCNPDFLQTLPEKNFREGCAEIIKYGILYDPALFIHLEEKGPDFDREYVISRCVELKRDAVEADEFDRGSRRFLNLGHTFGHAIEAESGFHIPHGEAVGTGIAMVTRAAAKAGLCPPATAERICSLLQKFGLPLYTDFAPEYLWHAALSDKKATGGCIHVIIPREIGSCQIVPMDDRQLLSFLTDGWQRDITLSPRKLRGTVQAPASKSCAHRALICAAISPTPTEILCGCVGRDVQETVAGLRELGAKIIETPRGFSVEPIQHRPDSASVFCRESGSTLRFLLPLAGALGVDATFYLGERLAQRPMHPLLQEMERMGCKIRQVADRILCSGQLQPGAYRVDGSLSSQFASGLKMALPLLPGSTLTATGEIASAPYLALTDAVMAQFPCDQFAVEGDWSNAAFFLAANALGSHIKLGGLKEHSAQADKAVARLLPLFDGTPTVSATDIPDLIPILSVVAAAKHGAVFTDIARLRLKESDRVAAIEEMLTALGGRAEVTENTLTVFPAKLTGGVVDAKNDHRIAMAAAIAATVCEKEVTVLGAECVKKSYPAFWEDYERLGGCLCQVSMAKA